MERSVKILTAVSILALTLVIIFDVTGYFDPPAQLNKRLLLTEQKTNQLLIKEPISPIPETLVLNNQKVLLGATLFHDQNLSQNNTLSCASCHDLNKGGSDNLPLPVTSHQEGEKNTLPVFNTPTVFNTVFNFVQTWKGTAKTLEEQAITPLFNPSEMGNKDWSKILNYLSHSAEYQPLFKMLYPSPISGEYVLDAIAEFERSLITPNARFDLYLKGDPHALSPYELEGYQLFKDRGCIACHHGINVGGTMFQKSGIFKPMFEETEQNKNLNTTLNINDKTMLKVPSLRNITLTAPYFHNGSVDALEEAIDIMAKHQLGITLPADENNKIQAFLKTLTGQYKGQQL